MNKQQKINIELIRLARHNNLNGEVIANDLLKNEQLWYSVSSNNDCSRYLPLYDMHKFWHVDTIQILCKKENANALKKLAKTWNPESITIYRDNDWHIAPPGGNSKEFAYINVWWD